jgi:hypothetical protein
MPALSRLTKPNTVNDCSHFLNEPLRVKEREFNNLGICHCEEERRSNLRPVYGDCFGLTASQ